MILNENSPITFKDTLPREVDVVVIGAGIIGISIAYFLGKQGKKVLVCEKGRVAGEQSSRNWGWVRQQGRHSSELPIMKESLRIWQGLAEEIGEDLGFRQCGCLYLAETDAMEQENEDWLDIAREHSLDTKSLSGREVQSLLGQKDKYWKSAIYTASDGRAEPSIAVPRLARAAQRLGVKIIENCAVRSLDVVAGKLSGVHTELGRVEAKQVVSAAGAWSSLFAGHHNIALPQLRVKGTVARTEPVADFFQGNAASENIAFRRRTDGGYSIALADQSSHSIIPDSFRYLPKFLPLLKKSYRDVSLKFDRSFFKEIGYRAKKNPTVVSPFERNRVLSPKPDQSMLKQMRENLRTHVPELANAAFVESWAGMIETTPDVLPIVSEADHIKGFYMVSGLSGHGFGIGPGMGKVVADLICGRPMEYDLSRFKLDRFHDGSPIKLGMSA
ncbi:FAD-binding oxidoreductase [Kiloniella sp. EL199]|uniref:NAD(P)/FAD-dependent oxidoreductase n=1 Tax=Kiloniella sp. EL199 TaxID=2107581 RepID=UPI0013C442FA|nr:FAD-binding oxidoreductase [Kiloniella sp. EL199]